MPTHVITITRNGNNQVVIQPAQLRVPFEAGAPPQELVWQAFGAKITGVQILNNDGSISTPQKVGDTKWTATDKNGNTSGSPKTYTYAISIDPEIVNESEPPLGGDEEDEDEDDEEGDG